MSYLNQSQLDVAGLLSLGVHVPRAADTLPQTATEAIYTVTGRVIIMRLFATVTTVFQSTDPVLKVTSNPTTGTSLDIASTVDSKDAEVGGSLVVEGDGTALVLGTAGAAYLAGNPWMANSGTIDLTAGASKTGALKWDLYYFPLEDGASVVAA